MALRLRIQLLAFVLLHLGRLIGPNNNATKILTATGFMIGVVMVKTGDFAQTSSLMITKGLVDVHK